MRYRLTCVCILVVCAFTVVSLACDAEKGQVVTSASGTAADGPWSIAKPWSGSVPTPPRLYPARRDGKWGFIDKTGQVAIGFRYEEASDFSDGLAAVRVGSEWGYVNESGTMAIAPQFSEGFGFYDGLAQVVTATGIGYMDKTGRLVIPDDPEWQDAFRFSEGLAGVWFKDQTYGYIDTSGKTVIRLPRATAAGEFSDGLAYVRERGQYGYIDRTGRFVIKAQFVEATEFSDGLAVVLDQSRKLTIIDMAGNAVVTRDVVPIFEGYPRSFADGRSAIVKDARWGFMDTSGVAVIYPQFKLVGDFAGGLVQVECENGKMAYIDLNGKFVWREQ